MDEALGRSVLDKEKKMVEVNSASDGKEVDKTEEVDQLESARAEMTQVKEENERLKTYLNQISRDYRSLQMQFLESSKYEPNKPLSMAKIDGRPKLEGADDIISLSLGMASSLTNPKKEDKKGLVLEKKFDNEEGLALRLDCKFEASKSGTTESQPNPNPDNSFEEEAKEDAGETWLPSKVLKTKRSGEDNEVSKQNPVKRARVSVRARCDTPTMNDGCQWRKYGQKISKGNPCPRAYYRCTVEPSCPVRKQVQRCVEDMSILITTYEGTHNHRLPMSANAMASTTSAAAHMLLAGSSSSSSRPDNVTANLQAGINCLSNASRPIPLYTPNTSSSYASTSCPTITLDLTSNPPSSSSSNFSRFSSQYSSTITRYPTESLNFGNIPSIDSSNTRPLSSWGGNGSHVNSFGPQLFNKNNMPTDSQKTIPNLPQNGLLDSISAATKAIAADPSFQSALAAALKSIIGGNFGGNAEHFRS